MAANEYTTDPSIGLNWRVQTTSIPRLARPEVNRSGNAVRLAGDGSIPPAAPAPDAAVKNSDGATRLPPRSRRANAQPKAQAAITALNPAAIHRVLVKPSNSMKMNADPM